MMCRSEATVTSVDNNRVLAFGAQILTTEHGDAINYVEFSGTVGVGDRVLLNTTARELGLGTGGYDFVIAQLGSESSTGSATRSDGHLMRMRYTPLQHSASACEESDDFSAVSDRLLEGFPVVACELHSQIAPVSAAISMHRGTCAYAMTDSACLGIGFSNLVSSLVSAGLIRKTLTVGQAFGTSLSDYAVTLHDALIAAKHCAGMDTAVVCQGPGNTGTNTKYGFSGIAQASYLDTIAALGGTPIVCVRASSGDKRLRHQGISHHTLTVMELVRSKCVVALPAGLDPPAGWLERHEVSIVPRDKTQPVIDYLSDRNIEVTTMGRSTADDELFFHTAAAAGVTASATAKGTKA